MKQEMKKKSDAPFHQTTKSDIHDELGKVSSQQTTEDADMSEPPFILTTETSEVKYKSTDVGTTVTTPGRIGPIYYIVRNADMEGGQALCEEMAAKGHLVWIENATENQVVHELLQNSSIKQAYIGSIWDPEHESILYYPSREKATFHRTLDGMINLPTDNSTIHCVSMSIRMWSDEFSWIIGPCNFELGCVCEQEY